MELSFFPLSLSLFWFLKNFLFLTLFVNAGIKNLVVCFQKKRNFTFFSHFSNDWAVTQSTERKKQKNNLFFLPPLLLQ
jgi:hypothetical protein